MNAGKRTMDGRRPRAALALGVLSGALAAITVMPTVVPISYRLVDAHERAAVRLAATAAAATATYPMAAFARDTLASDLSLDHLGVAETAGAAVRWTGPPPEAALPRCTEPSAGLLRASTTLLAVACHPRQDGGVVVAAVAPRDDDGFFVGAFVLGLAAMVGLSTALGVLQLLSPLSQLGLALDRVGAGERGVRGGGTGLRELDELVERLNAAAAAVEDSEDAAV